MTKKDYEILAAAIAGAKRSISLDIEHFPTTKTATATAAISLVAREISTALAQQNPRFRRDIFLRACGL